MGTRWGSRVSMPGYTSLFDQPEVAHARRSDPQTSVIAARKASKRLSPTQAKVYEALCGPALTDDEMCAVVRMNHPSFKVTDQSLRSRRAELVTKGKVRQVGMGTSAHGGPSATWKAVE